MSDGEALADLDAAGSLDPAERWRTCPTLADCSATNGHATLRPPAPTPNTRQPIRDPMQPDPIQLLTALQEIAPDILSAARSREVGERNATGEPGPTAELADALAAEAMADQGERTDELRRIVAAWRHEQPAPSATFTPAVLRALESALSADVGDQAEATDTLNALADALDPPKLRPLRAYADAPVPAPVLWRDPAAAEPETAHPDAVLSIGEVALLSAAGGIGKSMTVLALAVAAAHAHVKGQAAGAACGLCA